MNSRQTQVDVAVKATAQLGEGPAWDARTNTLLWVDILPGHVHRSDLATGHTQTTICDQPVTAVIPGPDPLPVASRDGFGYLHPNGIIDLVVPTSPGPAIRMNDGKCDHQGRFWAGSMAEDQQSPHGALFCWTEQRQAKTIRSTITISNGIDWSRDGTTMYYIDSATQRIDRFAVRQCLTLEPLSPLATIELTDGIPDGLTVDDDDCIWVALISAVKLSD